jgi:glycosyltransferase involved in cell wall biosynthesis
VKILLFANTDWYLYNFRLALAQAMQALGHDVVLVSPEGNYAPRLKALGLHWICFPLTRRGMNPLLEISTVVRLYSLYRKEKPDLVHQFTVKCVLYGSLACYLLGIRPVVNSVTGLGYVFNDGNGTRRWLRGFIILFNRLVLRRTWVIFQNPDDRAIFQENRLVDPRRVALIRGSGVDIQRFAPSPEPDGVVVVILPARLLWDKGVGEFVEAARQVQGDGLDARFVLVGDSDSDNPAGVPVKQIKEWQKSGVIEWWGWRDDMDAVYAQAHVVCLPSNYREGVPKTLIEAAACGRPIVASDVPGCREIVRPGENGLLIPARNIAALVASLKQLIQDSEMRHQMGIRGRKIAEEEFSMDQVISHTLDVYHAATGIKAEMKK